MSQIRHQDAITKATLLIDNGYSASYVYEKLLKEGFGEEEAKSVLESLTTIPFAKPTISTNAASPSPSPTSPSENRGLFNAQNLLILGILLALLGFILSFVLPTDWRVLAYIILLAGPILILVAAIRTSS